MALKILLVDDSHITLNLGKKILTDAGFDVTIADGGNAAVEKLARFKPDLIVLDSYMPDFDGFELCRAMKSARRTARTPIILTAGKLEPLFTGDSTGADDGKISQFVQRRLFRRFRHRGSAVRADAILRKPFDAADLVYVVQQLTHLGALPAGTGASKASMQTDKPALQRLNSGWMIILREPQVPSELVVASPPSPGETLQGNPALAEDDPFSTSQAPELSAALSEDLQSSEIQFRFPASADIDFTLAEPAVLEERDPESIPAQIELPAPELMSSLEPPALEPITREDLNSSGESSLDFCEREVHPPEPPGFPYEQSWVPAHDSESGFDWQPRNLEEPGYFAEIQHASYELNDQFEWTPISEPRTGFDWIPQASFADVNSEFLPGELTPTHAELTEIEPPEFDCAFPELPAKAEAHPIIEGPFESLHEHRELPPDLPEFDQPMSLATELCSDAHDSCEPPSELPPPLENPHEVILESLEHAAEIEPAAVVPEPVPGDCVSFGEPVLEVNREPDEGPWSEPPSRSEMPAGRIRRATLREEWVRFVPPPALVAQAAGTASAVPETHRPAGAETEAVQEQGASPLPRPSGLASPSHARDAGRGFRGNYRLGNTPILDPSRQDDQVTLDLDALALSLIPEPVQEEDSYATAQETAAGLNSAPMEDIDLERFLTPEPDQAETPSVSPYSNYRPSDALLEPEASAEEEEPVPIAFDLAKYLALEPIDAAARVPSPPGQGPSALFAEAAPGATAEQMVDEALEKIRPGLIEEARRLLRQHPDTTGAAK